MSDGFGGAPLIKPRRQGTTLSVDPPRDEFPRNPQIPEKIPQHRFFSVLTLQQQSPRYNTVNFIMKLTLTDEL